MAIAGTLTQQEIQQAIQQAQQVAASATQAIQSGQFVYVANFDGTNNDQNDLAESGDSQSTNIAVLNQMINGQSNPNVVSGYYAGVGTDGTLLGSEWIPSQVTQQVIDTAFAAYNNFSAAALDWLANNPGGSVTSMVTGFSRGCASASVFSHILYEVGLVDPTTGATIIAPGQVDVAGALMFDPVLTGVDGNMSFAPNTPNITVIRAMDEFRYLFQGADYNDPNVSYIDFYGNHGDVGGFYDQGLGALSLEGAVGYLQNSGLNMGAIPTDRAYDSSQPVNLHTEGVDENGNVQYVEHGSRGNRLIESVGNPANIQVMPDGTVVQTMTLYDGRIIEFTTDFSGEIVSIDIIENAGQTLLDNMIEYGPSVSSALSLLVALQSGQPLPIIQNTFGLANNLEQLYGDGPVSELSGITSVASGISALMTLDVALHEGDVMQAVTSATQAVGYGAQAYMHFADAIGIDTPTADSINSILNGDGSGPGVISYLNLVNGIVDGDPEAVALSVISMIPTLSWLSTAYAIYQAVDSLLNGGVPDPWGSGKVVWDGTGLKVETVGETGGKEATEAVMQGLVDTLNTIVENQQAANPDNQLGIIPNRMPTVGYDTSGFRYTDIDPLSGAENHAYLRFDTSGKPYNAELGSPEAAHSLIEGMIYSALDREAIAPMWEVETAKMQTDAGDPKAGLTEEARAGRAGKLATPVEGDTQMFRPVMLDLDGDGIETIARADAGVSFNVDDSGFLKNTSWLSGDDAFLTLDRNYNGSIDGGREMFSNATVALGERGLSGMAWVDANYDGKLTFADPVWNELKLWQDLNQDGRQNTGEMQALDDLGITELNYSMGTFTQDGVQKQLGSPDLEADKDGTRVTLVPEGIIIEKSADGSMTLIVTSATDNSNNVPNGDIVNGVEDKTTTILASILLANDALGNYTSQDLTIVEVLNPRHGTVELDGNGNVQFVPEQDFAGEGAGFDYTIQAPDGQQSTTTVEVILRAENDAPVFSEQVDHTIRNIYGYTPVVYSTRNDTEYRFGGNPIYTPYAIESVLTNGKFRDVYHYNPEPGHGTWHYHTSPVATAESGAGQVYATDIDDPTDSLTFSLDVAPLYGEVTVNDDGTFQYTAWKWPDTPRDNVIVNGEYVAIYDNGVTAPVLYTETQLPPGGMPAPRDGFRVKVSDGHGGVAYKDIVVDHYGPYAVPLPGGGGKPIAVDLNGDGFNFVDVNDSNVFFDMDGDGWKQRTSWVGSDDGLLVYDVDGDGLITNTDEISFVDYLDSAQTDLEGLAAFDTNADGIFDANDDMWTKFGVWQDANQNGITDAGELHSLDAMGVTSVGLTSDGNFQIINGQTVHGVAAMQMADGSQLDLADVTLAYSNEAQVTRPDGTTSTVTTSPFSPDGEEINGTDGSDLIIGKNGNNIVNGLAGDDLIFEDGGNDVIDAGDGNDMVYAGADNDLVFGGSGNDTIYAGLGDDVVFGGDGHDAIFAEGGNDVVFAGDGNDLISGGAGNDVLSGNDGNDQVYGEAGFDALFGLAGDDELAGMAGDDRLDGGAGYDLLDGGTGADEMIGGTGNDTYMVDDVGDTVTELAGEGEDSVHASIDYTLGENVENLTLAGTDNLSGSGNMLDNRLTGNAGDNNLDGGAGNDTLNGGAGADTMLGGAGDDTYIVDNVGDTVVEAAGEGIDTVESSIDYTLGDNLE
uniref:Ig-like domain-containing protein n=1 Tax=Sedimenticola sp. TaxID=1940285 RepID=UPI003D0C101E